MNDMGAMTGHTKGPIEVVETDAGYWLISEERGHIGTALPYYSDRKRNAANAALWAAAPALKEALEWAMNEIDALSNRLCKFGYPQAIPMIFDHTVDETQRKYFEARAALRLVDMGE